MTDDKDVPEGSPEPPSYAFEKLSKDLIEQVASIAQTQTVITRSFEAIVQPLQDAIRLTLPRLNLDLSWVHEAWVGAMPPNWRDLEPNDVDRVLTVMDETGWCLAWCPRVHIIRELLTTDTIDARERTLLGSRAAIVEDMQECVGGMSHSGSTDYRRTVTLAISAFDAGHVEAAQALAAAEISAIINGGFKLNFADARERFRGDPTQETVNAFREQAVLNMVARSLQRYYADLGDPPPPGFSRHATIHSVSAEQYNEVNSLASLLLAVAFSKEVDLLMSWREQDPEDASTAE